MGDRSGNIRWWDVTSGLSSSFSTHREGIRRIKFSPVVHGDRSRGRIAVLFYDNTFSIFDLVSTSKCYDHIIFGSSSFRAYYLWYMVLRYWVSMFDSK
jgi:WD40 repeat protein